MANKRASGQSLLGFWADPELAQRVDAARGHASRSQFLRDALAEKLTGLGIAVPRQIVVAPDRAGKGGKPTHRDRRKPETEVAASEPSSFPVPDSIGYGKTGQKRGFSETAQVVAETGSEYRAPVANVPPPTREVPAEPLPDHTPAQRDAVMGSIPAVMKIARERAPGDRKRLAAQKAKAAKAAQDKAAMAARAEAWRAKQGK